MKERKFNTIFKDDIEKIMEETIECYKTLHKNPEVAFKEKETSNFIYNEISKIKGIDEVTRPTETSVVARLIGKNSGRKIAFRADIDALPITEEVDIDYKSQNEGVMHACGHDSHTTMLLSALKILATKKDQINGEIRFLFQHAEEVPPGGAVDLVEAGALKDIEHIFSFHVTSLAPTGVFVYKKGDFSAASDTFYVKIIGQGGHASLPQNCIDPVVIACNVVTNLQTIASRNSNPLNMPVLSITSIESGTTTNVIPDEANFKGTLRSLNEDVRIKTKELFNRITENVAKAHGAKCEIIWEKGYEIGYNNKETTDLFVESLKEFVSDEQTVELFTSQYGVEDFAVYQKITKGCQIFIGTWDLLDPETNNSVHSSKFKLDLNALKYGIAGFLHVSKKLVFNNNK